jgi:hypothetical protein
MIFENKNPFRFAKQFNESSGVFTIAYTSLKEIFREIGDPIFINFPEKNDASTIDS